MGIYEIGQKADNILLYSQSIDMQKVSLLGKYMRGRIMVSAGIKPYISVKVLPKQSPVDAINDALTVMKKQNEGEK